MGDRNLDNWVSDQLHALLGAHVPCTYTILVWQRELKQEGCEESVVDLQAQLDIAGHAGFAESAIVSYVISLGRKASNAAVLARQLEGQVSCFPRLTSVDTLQHCVANSTERTGSLSPRCMGISLCVIE